MINNVTLQSKSSSPGGQPGSTRLLGGYLALLLYLASALIGLWVAYDPALSGLMLVTIGISVTLFLAILHGPLPSAWISRGLVGSAGLLALYFVSQYPHLGYQDETGWLARLGAWPTFTPDLAFFRPHPNAVASFLEGVLLVGLVLSRPAQGRVHWGWTVVTGLIGYALLLTQSRGAGLGLLAAGALGLALRRPHLRPVVGIGAGIAAAVGVALFFYGQAGLPLARLGPEGLGLNTTFSRLTLYQNSWHLLGDYLFTGLGLGDTFAMVYSRYQLQIHVPYLYYAHNLFLSVGLAQGVLGLIALGWLIGGFYWLVFVVERGELAARRRAYFQAAWLGITVILIHGLTDSGQYSPDFWSLLMPFALAGLALRISRPAWAAGGGLGRLRRAGAAAAILAGLGVVALVIFWRPLSAAWYANLGAVYDTQADLAPALSDEQRLEAKTQARRYFEQALALRPSQTTANRRLGLIALEQRQFETAVAHLERAYPQEPHNQATLKALGYAYLWTGQLDQAQPLLARLHDQNRLQAELRYWQRFWPTQNRPELAAYAEALLTALFEESS